MVEPSAANQISRKFRWVRAPATRDVQDCESSDDWASGSAGEDKARGSLSESRGSEVPRFRSAEALGYLRRERVVIAIS